MNSRTLRGLAAAASLLLAACSTDGFNSMAISEGNFGEASRQTFAAQVVNPDPDYGDTAMTASGDAAAKAAERVRTGHFRLHGVGLGRLGALAGFDHAVLDAARQGLHARLGLVGRNELVALGLVFGSSLFVLGLGGLGTALLTLLERFNGRLQLLGGDRRLLLGVGVLQTLHHRVDVQLLTTTGQLR